MISYIKGKITVKTPTRVVVETYGIGYNILISLHTYAQIEKQEDVHLNTHLHVKEDSHTLYGFADPEERRLFRMLISVSGVGPNTALIILSSLPPDQVRSAIVHEDVALFNKVKGVGPKTAQRIILDLKDKVAKSLPVGVLTTTGQDNTLRYEALSALVALGFARNQASKVVDKVIKQDPKNGNLEWLVKQSLRELSN